MMFTRPELIQHCIAYSAALHKLAHEAQKIQNRNYRLKLRIKAMKRCCDNHTR